MESSEEKKNFKCVFDKQEVSEESIKDMEHKITEVYMYECILLIIMQAT
jgi:hypothetical protein